MPTNHNRYKQYEATVVDMLASAGIDLTIIITGSIFDHWMRGTTLSEIETLVKGKTNANHGLQPHSTFDEKLQNLKKHFNQHLKSNEDAEKQIMDRIIGADETSRSGIAAANAVQLIDLLQSIRAFRSVLTWFDKLESQNVPAAQQFLRVFHGVTKDLAFHASNVTVYSTSAQANLENRAKATAYGVIVDHFSFLMQA
jgi:hypothetical protein